MNERCQAFVQQLVERSLPESHVVRKLCQERIKKAWCATASTGSMPASHQIPLIAQAVVERVKQHALKTRVSRWRMLCSVQRETAE